MILIQCIQSILLWDEEATKIKMILLHCIQSIPALGLKKTPRSR